MTDHRFSPNLICSVQPNPEVALGAQFLRGSAGAEYGRFADVCFGHAPWFFRTSTG